MRLLAAFLVCAAANAQAPDVSAQRAAMQKLAFLAGAWKGEGTVFQQSGPIKVLQTESVEYKLDGLVLLIEGTGRNPEGEIKFRAFATVAYDDTARSYRFRSYNDGRYLDTEFKLLDQGFEWGYQAGAVKVRFVMRLNEKGEWAESGEVALPNGQTRKTLDMTVRKQKP